MNNDNSSGVEQMKCVVVGDGAVGKTSLLMSYVTNTLPDEYIPTLFDTTTKHVLLNDKAYELVLSDTAGGKDYNRLRPLAYPQAKIILICFSIISRSSYENVGPMWLPEVKRHAPQASILLNCGHKN